MGDAYPAPYSSSALMLFMATIQCTVFGAIMVPHAREWALYPGIRALASVYGVCYTTRIN